MLHTPPALIAGGQIEVMWRNAVDGARDMYLARSRDGITIFEAGEAPERGAGN